jgi:DNA replication and repair protein RecF
LEQGRRELEEPFDRQWAEGALAVMRERETYLADLQGPWRRRFHELLGETLLIDWHWSGPLRGSGGLPDIAEMLAALDRIKPEERRRGRSLLGPQRDDLVADFSAHPVKEIASQGQQRMLVIALKLAEADLFQAVSGRPPVFLLDDLGSELDARHQALLLEMLGRLEAQTLMTSAQSGAFAGLVARTFRVCNGLLSG